MSLTVTITNSSAVTITNQSAVKTMLSMLPLAERVQTRCDAVIKAILESDLFVSKDQQEYIHSWKKAFDQGYLKALNSADGRDEASIALSMFLYDRIFPAIAANEGHRKQQLQLLEIVDAFKEIIKLVLPASENIDQFLEQYEKCYAQEGIFKEKVKKMTACFQKHMDEIAEYAKGTQERILKVFEDFKLCLKLVNDSRLSLTKTMNERFDQLTSEVEKLLQNFEATEKKVQTVSERFLKNHRAFNQSISNCLEMLKEL